MDRRPWPERRNAALANMTLRETLGITTRRFHVNRQKVYEGFPEGEAARQRAVADKRAAIRHSEELIEVFSHAVRNNGGEVHRAGRAEDAVAIVTDIARSANVRLVVKTKSMTTEEIELNKGLMQVGIQVLETDLGEYIIQRANEPPSHILAPAAHKNRQDVLQLFRRDADESHEQEPGGDDAQELTRYARRRLRKEFLRADMGVTGGNFLVAETGTLVLITNEGNADLVTTLPPLLVSVVGIEKVITDWNALGNIIQQPAMNGVGQRLSSYTTFITGPTGAQSSEGPRSWHVVLLDNGRSAIRNTPYEDVLSCIRCGACLNACPVFRQIGGAAYGTVYSGPIGIVEVPLLTNFSVLSELPSVGCTVCHACAEVCPMDIQLPAHILSLRHEKVRRSMVPAATRQTYRLWAKLWSTPGGYRNSIRLARWGQRFYVRKGLLRSAPGLMGGWFESRNMPPVAHETFHEWWQRHRIGGDHSYE